MPTAALVVLLYGLPYARRARTLRTRGRPVAHGRIACFSAGLACVVVAGALGDARLMAHMGEHLLLGDVAPLLMAVGCTGPVLAPVLRRTGDLRRLGHPAVALAAWAVALYAWHVPAAYDATLRSPALHALQHATFAATGFNLWFALLGPLPKPRWFTAPVRLGWVAAWWITGSGLAALLAFSASPLYPSYPNVADQSAAGALMMIDQATIAVGLFSWTFLSLFAVKPAR